MADSAHIFCNERKLIVLGGIEFGVLIVNHVLQEVAEVIASQTGVECNVMRLYVGNSASHRSRCSCSAICASIEDFVFSHLIAKKLNDSTDAEDTISHALHVLCGSICLTIDRPKNLQPYEKSTSRDEKTAEEAGLPSASVSKDPMTEAPVPALVQPSHVRSEEMFGEFIIDSARSQISPTTVSHKHMGDTTVATDDPRFVDILFQSTKIFAPATVEILIVRHKRNRLLEMIVCTEGARVEVGHFYVRHEDLLSVVSQKEIQTKLRMAVQGWKDGLPDIRALLRCATTKVMTEYLLEHLEIVVEESHHGLTNLVARFVPDESSGKQLPSIILTEKPAQVPKLRWQHSNAGMATIEECPECRELSLRMKGAPANGVNRLKDAETKKTQSQGASADQEQISGEVRQKPHRHNSLFSYFSPFSSDTMSLRTRSSDARDEADDDAAPPVGMLQQFLNAMGAGSMRVLPVDDMDSVKGREMPRRHMSASTVSVSSGVSELSSKSAPSALSIPCSE